MNPNSKSLKRKFLFNIYIPKVPDEFETSHFTKERGRLRGSRLITCTEKGVLKILNEL